VAISQEPPSFSCIAQCSVITAKITDYTD